MCALYILSCCPNSQTLATMNTTTLNTFCFVFFFLCISSFLVAWTFCLPFQPPTNNENCFLKKKKNKKPIDYASIFMYIAHFAPEPAWTTQSFKWFILSRRSSVWLTSVYYYIFFFSWIAKNKIKINKFHLKKYSEVNNKTIKNSHKYGCQWWMCVCLCLIHLDGI